MDAEKFHMCRAGIRRAIALAFACMCLCPLSTPAQTIPGLHRNLGGPSPDALPQLRGIIQGVSGVVEIPNQNKLEVHQDQEKAIIEWESFDIGKDAWTHFDQQGNSDWVALNRIYDQNPSRIFGRLTADGRIYLINQNGILFGPESNVNVHSLIGTTLNIANEDFINGTLSLKSENYINPADPVNTGAAITNHGVIQTDETGSILLIAPYVENSGTLESPSGRVGLVAGLEVDISPDETVSLLDPGGASNSAVNTESGRLIADTGTAGMYGYEVHQEGLVRSVTAVKKGGKIELRAVNKVYTGRNSLTTSAISDSTETAHTSFPFEGGLINIKGLDDSTPVRLIEHWGEITAPSGTVNLIAGGRVFLGSGSRVDVSGSWMNLPAEAATMTLQLNTNELRDEYTQKGGLLQGEAITLHETTGSTIGDLSSHLTSEEVAAMERSTYGGEILVKVTGEGGDIILKDGASMHFSGGGIHYDEGYVETTKLLGGMKIYDISEASESMRFEKVMGLHESYHERYGITEAFEGLYFGGANPVKDFVAAHTEGRDAGTLTLIASRIVLDGEIRGSVERGVYQTEAAEPEDENENQSAAGRLEPAGGTLVLGDPFWDSAVPESGLHDFVLDEVLVKAETQPLEEGFGADPAAYAFPEDREGKTILTAEIINAAGLSNLRIYTNGLFETEADAGIALRPGNRKEGWVDEDGRHIGRFDAVAGNILHRGTIDVPAGTIRMVVRDTTADFPEGAKKLVLAGGSRLLAAGEEIDNSMAGRSRDGSPVRAGHIHGGRISLVDGTGAGGKGVFILPGALADVSGGYRIDENGGVEPGDGGALEIAGPTLLLQGEIAGRSMVGGNGGAVSLHADEIHVVRPGTAPEFDPGSPPAMDRLNEAAAAMGLEGKLVLAGDRLAETGFARIELISQSDVFLEQGAALEPSRVKRSMPLPEQGGGLGMLNNVSTLARGGSPLEGSREYLVVDPVNAGDTAVTLIAGEPRQFVEVDDDVLNRSRIHLETGSRIHVAPGGSITMKAPGIAVDGELKALSGGISLTATYADLKLGGTGRILAPGYNRPDSSSLMTGLATGFDPQPGGEVILTAGSDSDSLTGNLVLEAGSLIDVSGSEPAETHILDPNGGYSSVQVAGAPGSLELAYKGSLTLDGDIRGQARLEGLRGGALTLSHLNTLDSAAGLEVTAAQIREFTEKGFDDLTLRSVQRIALAGPMDVDVGRRLTLDAPHMEGLGEGLIRFRSPWIRLMNSREQYLSQAEYTNILNRADAGTSASLELAAGWLDLEGSVLMTGFNTVLLAADYDARLTESYYKLGVESPKNLWEGLLKTSADLTIKAARIYPTTHSDFTVQGGSRMDILPGDTAPVGPVLSAGGSITLEAERIFHKGTLTAPHGRIALIGDADSGEVVLEPGSALLTSGELPVLYGSLEDQVWRIQDKTAAPTGLGLEVTDLPEKAVEVSARSVVLREGARVDVSGGGLLFSYLFEPGLQGTENPLTRPGRYVILPESAPALPGEAVYLEGGEGIAAGVYPLLPEWCAFLPGAMVITDLAEAGSGYTPGQLYTPEGYPVIQGYATVAGTKIESALLSGYSIRHASEVLEEGAFTIAESEAGAAGGIEIHGESAVLGGEVLIQSLSHYRGGTISVSGRHIAIGSPTDGFSAGLNVDPSFFTDMDLEELRIGDQGLAPSLQTEEIRMYSGAIEAPRVALSAEGDVTLFPGAEIHALDESVRLDHLIYQYDYDPNVGLNIVRIEGVQAMGDEDAWVGQIRLKTAEGFESLELLGQDNTVRSVLYKGSVDMPAGFEVPILGDSGVVGGRGIGDLVSESGTISLKTRAVVHASHEVGLDGQLDIEEGAVVESDHSTLHLKGSTIYFVPAGTPKGSDGLYLSDAMWRNFSSFDDITLLSRSDLVFVGDHDLSAAGRLTIHAARIAGTDGDETVGLFAPELRVVNKGSSSNKGGILEDDEGQLTLAADLLEVGMRWFAETQSNRRITTDGFNSIKLSGREVAFTGQGTLDTGGDPSSSGGDLNISAGRITTNMYAEETETGSFDYGTTFLKIDAGTRTVSIDGAGGSSGGDAQAGGRLEIHGGIISVGKAGEPNPALIEMPSGVLGLYADDSILLGEGSRIDLRGTDISPGGIAEIRADSGTVALNAGSLTSVAAGGRGDAGEIVLAAPGGGMILEGDLAGSSAGGAGGAFSVDAGQAPDLDTLNAKLAAGGFTERVSVRARTGDLELGSAVQGSPGITVKSRDYSLMADGGSVVLHANTSIDATGEGEGGRVALYAGENVRIEGEIIAAGTGEGSTGGEVLLNSAHRDGSGKIHLDGGLVDVSGRNGGGTVRFRVDGAGQADAADLTGVVRGASRVVAETVNYYERSGNIGGIFALPAPGPFAHGLKDAGGNDLTVEKTTGIEIWSPEGVDLTLNQAWSLGSSNPGGMPGVLTLRSGGDLNIEADILDSRSSLYGSSRYALFTNVAGPVTWGINLVAGADVESANPMAFKTGAGDLTLADKKLVYTEGADIGFAAGNDAVFLHGKTGGLMINTYMTYNIGTYSGDIRGSTGRDLKLGGSSAQLSDQSAGIQTALGDIEIEVGRDLTLKYLDNTKSVGIRTTGGVPRLIWQEAWRTDPGLWPEGYEDIVASVAKKYPRTPFWGQRYLDQDIHAYYHNKYGNGGDLELRIGRDLKAGGTQAFSGEAWDYAYKVGNWAASYEHSGGTYPSAVAGGLAAMAGGGIKVKTGGRFESKAGTFGRGDLSVFSLGDLNGKFLVREGEGTVETLGNFGLKPSSDKTIEAFDADFSIRAQGNALVGEVLNPTTREGSQFDKRDPYDNQLLELRYAEDASLRVESLLGDVRLPTGGIFPPVLIIEAGGDIHVEKNIVLAPSRNGQLSLTAGGDIEGLYGNGRLHAEIILSDLAPEAAYAYYPMPSFEYTYPEGHAKAGQTVTIDYQPTRALVENRYMHGFPSQQTRTPPSGQDYFSVYRGMVNSGMALVENEADRVFFEGVAGLMTTPVHESDALSIDIKAGGEIRDISFSLPKQAHISAGGSIRDIYYLGQNNATDDLSIIQAQQNIVFQAEPVGAVYFVGIEQAGPGYLAVQAGNSIDLGETRGIKSIGDVFNGYIGSQGSSLVVMSGLHGEVESETAARDVDSFFGGLRTAGMEFSLLMAEGNTEEAQAVVEAARDETVAPFLDGYSQGQGDINMITSQIGSDAENSDVFILARGKVNVGKSTFFADEDDRGSTGIYTALGGDINIFSRSDVNVNESRIMTYMGGDITIWSDEGNINAGKGSKAAINVDPPKITWVGGIPVIKFIPPAVGSGIRCLTYDPDGYEGPLKPPAPGDIYLTAPEGVIDAGEAGIAGGNLFLGATQVLNAQNIEAAGLSVGVPAATQGAAGLSTLAGSSSLANMSDMGQEQAGMASNRGEAAQQAQKLAEAFTAKWLDVKVISFETDEKEERQ